MDARYCRSRHRPSTSTTSANLDARLCVAVVIPRVLPNALRPLDTQMHVPSTRLLYAASILHITTPFPPRSLRSVLKLRGNGADGTPCSMSKLPLRISTAFPILMTHRSCMIDHHSPLRHWSLLVLASGHIPPFGPDPLASFFRSRSHFLHLLPPHRPLGGQPLSSRPWCLGYETGLSPAPVVDLWRHEVL
jgi:hypothetical protein